MTLNKKHEKIQVNSYLPRQDHWEVLSIWVVKQYVTCKPLEIKHSLRLFYHCIQVLQSTSQKMMLFVVNVQCSVIYFFQFEKERSRSLPEDHVFRSHERNNPRIWLFLLHFHPHRAFYVDVNTDCHDYSPTIHRNLHQREWDLLKESVIRSRSCLCLYSSSPNAKFGLDMTQVTDESNKPCMRNIGVCFLPERFCGLSVMRCNSKI